ncbi:metalloreductase transmembrane component [Blastomyces dermatitidis ER-3]|uniref:Metalloreductase transmembrane component n=1 Tax=Ajellomyces dermatitidis (strain ER-3 / ATCC MYA-2586) TaxID=559297 RepID=A0ABP2F3N4_AJEDR|nr:metalloreductase transmembrane component [Blastomyces dermatitidis ER-3]EEQ91508.2 metalloreductase transmembrane component [Blastomyces dermatitidis ER-3]
MQILFFCYQNSAFMSHESSQTYVSYDSTDNNEKTSEDVKKAAVIQVVLPHSMKLNTEHKFVFEDTDSSLHDLFIIMRKINHVESLCEGSACDAGITAVHLMWQLVTTNPQLNMAIAVESAVNSLLKNDTVANGYMCEPILTISIYVESGGIMKLENHEHALVYKGLADYRNIIQTEVSGDHIKRVSNGEEDRGELLMMNKMRDQLRSVVHDFLHDRVTMSELEFQPR